MSDSPTPPGLVFTPIGVMRTPFVEKFGVPRQPLMVPEARGVIELGPDPRYRAAFAHIEKFSHVWVLYVFDQHLSAPWTPTILPPRVEGPRRVGVFASRSPHRPNPIGMSAVKLDRVEMDAPDGRVAVHVSGVDILDGTPVLDIKPYLPYADAIPDAVPGWAGVEIPRHRVSFTDRAREIADGPLCTARHPRFGVLVAEMLAWDPRPTPQRRTMPIGAAGTEGREFAFRLLGFDVRWQVHDGAIVVTDLIEV